MLEIIQEYAIIYMFERHLLDRHERTFGGIRMRRNNYDRNRDYPHPSYDASEDFLREARGDRGYYGGGRYSGSGELSTAQFNLLIGVILLFGLFLNYLMAKYCTEYFININPVVLIIGYLVLGFVGIGISNTSDNPFISFIGYLMVVVPTGVLISIFVAGEEGAVILNAILTTIGVTVVMIIAGQIFPGVFMSIGRALVIALFALIVVEIIMLIAGWSEPGFVDIIAALIFSGLIGYDWAIAQSRPHTVDGAVDACAGLYLDVINLFLRIESSSSRRRK